MHVIHLGLEIVPGSCEYNNEISGSIKSEEFLDHLDIYQFFKKKKNLCSKKFFVSSLNTNNIEY